MKTNPTTKTLKKTLALFALALPFAAAAECPELEGSYRCDDGKTLEIAQKGNRYSIGNDKGLQEFTAGGKTRRTVLDGLVFLATASCGNGTLNIAIASSQEKDGFLVKMDVAMTFAPREGGGLAFGQKMVGTYGSQTVLEKNKKSVCERVPGDAN